MNSYAHFTPASDTVEMPSVFAGRLAREDETAEVWLPLRPALDSRRRPKHAPPTGWARVAAVIAAAASGGLLAAVLEAAVR